MIKPCRLRWGCKITVLQINLQIISFKTVISAKHRVLCTLRTLLLVLAKINTVPAFLTPQIWISQEEVLEIKMNKADECSLSMIWIREIKISPACPRRCSSPTKFHTCKSRLVKGQLTCKCLENLVKKKGTTIWRTFQSRSWARTTIRKQTRHTKWTFRKSSHTTLLRCLQPMLKVQCDESAQNSTAPKTTTVAPTWECQTSLPATTVDKWDMWVKTRSLLQAMGYRWWIKREWAGIDLLMGLSLSRLPLSTS